MHFTLTINHERQESVDNDVYHYSPFQIEWMQGLAKRPDFDHLVTHGHPALLPGERPRKPGPVNALFYTKNGELHLHRLGVSKVLRILKR